VAESFGAIYERNAINAALPVIVCKSVSDLSLKTGHRIRIDFINGKILDLDNNKSTVAQPFSDVQLEIYRNGGLLKN
jgi:3-isopropylmalate dehydratase small subunit